MQPLSKESSLALISEIKAHHRFNSEEGIWKDTRAKGPLAHLAYPEMMHTESGKDVGFEILNERGYQWWRKGPLDQVQA